MSELNLSLKEMVETEFPLGTRNFYRPSLKQIGNSIYEIKTHYMSAGDINIVPKTTPSHLFGIRDKMLLHLDKDSFLFKNNIVTGSLDHSQLNVPCFVVLMDSLAPVLNFEVPFRPRNVNCDILLAICGQPLIVLTLVDGDKDSDSALMYNTAVASGVVDRLCEFMDESLHSVFGVICTRDLGQLDTFKNSMMKLSEESSLFVSNMSLTTNPSKYEKILTAFWASVAETKSVISGDAEYLRFLTKDQCMILIENINCREVEVLFKSDTGATTLMVEVSNRLSRLDETLLVCRSEEEKTRLRSVFQNITTATEIEPWHLSRYTNIVDETGTVTGSVDGKFWRCIKVDANEDLQEAVALFQKKKTNIENFIYLLSSGDRQDTIGHLSRELEIMKLFDISFQGFLSSYHIPLHLVHEFIPAKRSPGSDGNTDHKLEAEDYMRLVLGQFKLGIQGRRDMFPCLGDMVRQVKAIIACLQDKLDFFNTNPCDPAFEKCSSQNDRSLQKDVEHKILSVEYPKPKTGETLTNNGKPGKTGSVSEEQTSEKTEELIQRFNILKKTDFSEIKKIETHLKQRKMEDRTVPVEYPKPETRDLVKVKGRESEQTGDVSVVHDSEKTEDLPLRSKTRKMTDVYEFKGLPSKMNETHVGQKEMKNRTVEYLKPETRDPMKVKGKDSEETGYMSEVQVSEKTEELTQRLKSLKITTCQLEEQLHELTEGTDIHIEWKNTMDYVSQELADIRIKDVITDVIGEDKIQDMITNQTIRLDKGGCASKREASQNHAHKLRELQYGTLKKKDLLTIMRDVITDDHRSLFYLRTQTESLERAYGSRVCIVGELSTSRSWPVTCPPMTLDRERVWFELAVSDDNLELVNVGEYNHHTGQFKRYQGTCSRFAIPVPFFTCSFIDPKYWETHTRLRIKSKVSSWPLMEMGICGKRRVDGAYWVSDEKSSSWAIRVGVCHKHPSICAQIWEEGKQVGECQRDPLTNEKETFLLKYGIVVDAERGRLALLDVKREQILYKFDTTFTEPLIPMFGITTHSNRCHVEMKLISGSAIAFTDRKKNLLAKALFKHKMFVK